MAAPATKFWRDSEIVYGPVWKDSAGVVIDNTAKMPYPKPIVEPISIAVIHGVVYKSFSDADYYTQIDTVNSDTWRSWTAGQAWVSRIITDEKEFNQATYAEVHYIIRCTKRGWKAVFPEIGYVYVSGGNYVAFKDVDGQAYMGKLDGSGGQLSAGSDPIVTEQAHKASINFGSSLGF